MRIFLLGLFLAAAVPALSQERIAITGGKVVTNGGAPIEGGTVLMNDGVVVSVAPGVSVPAGYRQVDASGKWVTPGVIAGISQFGSSEISGNDTTNDQAARKSPGTAALMLDVALNPDETSIPVARQEGVTAAIVGPSPGRTLFAGQGYVLSLAEGTTVPMKARAFQYLSYGERGAELAGGSRPAAWNEITNALEEAKRVMNGLAFPARDQHPDLRVTREDAEALTLALRGAQPLLVRVDRASDIRQVLKLQTMYPGLRLVLVSANEGWRVADEIARAGVPVITLGMVNRPENFEYLSATMSNVGRMVAAGVKVALGTPDLDASFQPRNLTHYAGNLVAQGRLAGGVGLSWDQAFATITRNPAEIFGLPGQGVLRPGARADVVVWSGDPLELATQAEQVFILGVSQPLQSRQTELARRYLPGRDRTQLPESYSR
ncbi:amidohydrolase family protein [Sandaracinobacteroides hominis]|uniref:amidohydrolase family protein n=1 Tax=Sandaracinobacteroides hominis TaxID=2780086 RepID=UPI0018F37BE1|nr:amidohydrolase family protein [Sandaracinobacteroides hominis]